MTKFDVRAWQGFQRRNWDSLTRQLSEVPAQYQQRGAYALDDVASKTVNAVIAGGATLREPIAPAAPALLAALARAAADAAQRPLSFVALNHVDMLGVVASVGVEVPDVAFDQARAILAAVPTSRQDERVVNHFRRGFVAIALKEPRVYRGIIGHAGAAALPFRAGETFGPNVQGFLTHLAGAVEQGASMTACMPAFADFLAYYFALQEAGNVNSSALFWSAFTLHHLLGQQPLAGLGDWLHETLYRAADEEP